MIPDLKMKMEMKIKHINNQKSSKIEFYSKMKDFIVTNSQIEYLNNDTAYNQFK